MLTLASAEAGELVEPRAIDLGDFFEDVRRDLPLFGERDFGMQAVAGTLEADPDRLTQVLRNLVRNAVAHTKPGDRVEVAATALDGIGSRSRSATRDRVSPPRSSTRSSSAFTGSIAAARVTAAAPGSASRSRGRSSRRTAAGSRAESPPGHGATFRIELPGYRRLLRPSRRRHDLRRNLQLLESVSPCSVAAPARAPADGGAWTAPWSAPSVRTTSR